jgi:integrase
MLSDPFRPIGAGTGTPKKDNKWTPIVPVPKDAPLPPARHPQLGPPSETYVYLAADGRVSGYVMRFDLPGGKEFRPLTFCQHSSGGLNEWRWTTWQKPRPLFNLDKLHQRPAAPVLITEGEKASRAAEKLAPGYVCITSPGGSKSALQADWTPLNGRHVVVWPDNDDPGRQYAATVAKLCGEAGALRVLIIEPPGGVPAGWDAADALAEGFDEAQAARLFGAASRQQRKPQKPTADDVHGEGGGRQRGRPPQRDQLMGYVEGIELWHDDDGKAYATFPIGSHLENATVRSSRFRDWLTLKYFDDHQTAPGRTAMDESLGTLEALARRRERYTAFIRVAEQNGRIYHDLCNKDWQAVEISRHHWNTVDCPPVKFVRRDGMLPLPMPERVTDQQSGIAELRGFFGNLSQQHFALVVAWLMSCFRDTGAYPVLMIHALSASGKTFLTKLLTDLIDPTVDALQRIPDDELDLIARAMQAHVVGFDNVSHISNRQSDALCRIATGESFSKIKKYTDEERVIYTAKRPIVMNGIPRLAEKGSKFYYVNIWIDGREFPRSTKRTNEREAKAAVPDIERRLRAELSAALDGSISLTLDAVAGRYMLDVGDHHAGADNTRRLVALLIVHFGPTKLITEITHDDALGLIRWRRTHTVGKKKPRSISAYAVNDTIEQIKKLFTYLRPSLAKANPDKKPFPLEPEWAELWLDEPKRKPRELVGIEEERLVRAVFKVRPDLWPLIEFSRTCGKRKTNCYTLEWPQVDWDAGIIKMLGKGVAGGKEIEITITPSVRAILWPLRGQHTTRVFTFEAQRTSDKTIRGRRYQLVAGERHPWTRDGLRRAWDAVRKEAGLTGSTRFRWHDLRSDFASKLLRSVPSAQGMKMVQEALDHEDIKTTLDAYAHILEGEHATAIEALAEARRAREMQFRIHEPVQKPVQPATKKASRT